VWGKETKLLARNLIPLIAGVALVVAACGGGSDENNSGQNQPAASGNTEVGREEFGQTEEQLVNSIDAVESKIASCMADAGFDYTPIDNVTFRRGMDLVGGIVPGLSDDEFVAQYGYGITTRPPTAKFRFGDENERIIESLSPQDQVAYIRTLVGEKTEAIHVRMLEDEDFSQAGGCTEKAIKAVYSEEQLNPSFFNPFDKLVEEDPRMIDAQKSWSSCMRQAGFDYEKQGDPEDEFHERLDSLTGGADLTTLTGSDKDALIQLQGEELAVAAADSDCAAQHVFAIERQVEQDISGRN
jgi:hypothetical protein